MEGIRVVDNIIDLPGVETLEGRIGPILSGAGGSCHYIQMHNGQFLAEHPHSSESLIYTVSGEWVLCSGGERHHMKTGSLYWFGVDVPTGYELSLDSDAYILIFKAAPRASDDEFLEYLKGMSARIEEEHKQGTPFRMNELPEDHPALVFARGIR